MIKEYIDLSRKTTYKFGGEARYYLEYNINTTKEEISKIKNITNDIYFLGNGSNLAFSDKGYPGLVLRSKKDKISQLSENLLEVYSGTPMPEISRFCKTIGLSGAEFMIGIPGSIGGGVAMNAGAYESSISEILDKIYTYNFKKGEQEIYKRSDLSMGYRSVQGMEGKFVDKVHLVLEPADRKDIALKHREYLEHRKLTQPSGLYNAGSVFKNPKDSSAGKLIENSGLKGYRKGTVMVSKKHANFFVADRRAKSTDLYELVNYVKEKVHDRFEVRLEEEIRFVGEFG